MTTGNNTTRASKLSSRTNLSEVSTADTGIVGDIDNKVLTNQKSQFVVDHPVIPPLLQNPIPRPRLFPKLSNIDYTPTPHHKQNPPIQRFFPKLSNIDYTPTPHKQNTSNLQS